MIRRKLSLVAIPLLLGAIALPGIATDPSRSDPSETTVPEPLQDDLFTARKIQARVPLLDNETAWGRLPVDHGTSAPALPGWARALAASLPRTTAAMLDLDHKHRAQSPLDPLLRGRLRWIAADANRCGYGRAYAEADLRRAGADDDSLKALAGDLSGLHEPERAALLFARKTTLAADTVTDQEVARLMDLYGEQKVAAMVLLVAYANFQDRLLLALGVAVEPEGPLPPLRVKIDAQALAVDLPPRVRPAERPVPFAPTRVDDPEWRLIDFDQAREQLELQKARPSRIRVPSWEEVRSVLPPGYPPPARPIRIQWSLVCLGYQPELAAAWSACTRAFGEEAKQDRVFEESLFWVVTRTIHCFY